MQERARAVLIRLLDEAKEAGEVALRFEVPADRWAEVVSDSAGRVVEIIRDPNPNLLRQFRWVPVQLVELEEPKTAVMVCQSGKALSA